jgi:hypothetical protein
MKLPFVIFRVRKNEKPGRYLLITSRVFFSKKNGSLKSKRILSPIPLPPTVLRPAIPIARDAGRASPAIGMKISEPVLSGLWAVRAA